MKTYLSIIDETIAFYSADPSRRSINPTTDFCCYHGPDSRQCAFARYVTPETQPTLDILEGKTAEYCLNPDGTNDNPICAPVQLLPEVSHLTNPNFWNDLQQLHDSTHYWNDQGLTPEGQTEATRLKTLYS